MPFKVKLIIYIHIVKKIGWLKFLYFFEEFKINYGGVLKENEFKTY